MQYEKILYDDIKDGCCFEDIEIVIRANRSKIIKYAQDNNISPNDIEKQIRLHAPQFRKGSCTTRRFFENKVLPILDRLYSKDYSKKQSDYLLESGAYLIRNSSFQLIRRSGTVYIVPEQILEKHYIEGSERTIFDKDDSRVLKAIPKKVDDDTGEFIEEVLHYLKSRRENPIVRVGLSIEGYSLPICYMSYCHVDREEKRIALEKALGQEVDSSTIVELSRVFGCGHLPKYSISLLDSYAIKNYLGGYRYIITAVNIALGFTGDSVRASGYVPYATRPVSYFYDDHDVYCTKRKSERTGIEVKQNINDVPPNILYVKENSKFSSRRLEYCRMINIGNDYSFYETAIEHWIYNMRRNLESVWNAETRYHGTVVEKQDRPSKGQCGASSLLLAEILDKKGYDVYFCEGDVLFPSEGDQPVATTSIYHHCWIEVKNYNKHNVDVIIDITADQNGYKQKVIFKTIDDLKKLHIEYKESFSNPPKKPNDVDVEHLWTRLNLLEEGLKKEGKIYE